MSGILGVIILAYFELSLCLISFLCLVSMLISHSPIFVVSFLCFSQYVCSCCFCHYLREYSIVPVVSYLLLVVPGAHGVSCFLDSLLPLFLPVVSFNQLFLLFFVIKSFNLSHDSACFLSLVQSISTQTTGLRLNFLLECLD